MSTQRLRLWRLLSILLTVVITFCYGLNAQQTRNASVTGFTMQFVKDGTIGSVNQVASNVLRVINTTGRRSIFRLDVAYPVGWKNMADPEKVYNVANGDTLHIPIRMIPQKGSEGNVNYFINATAYTTSDIPLASAPWSMQISKVSNWFANMVDSEIYFPTDSNEAQFRVNIRNNGNSAENVIFYFNADVQLSIVDMDNNPFPENTMAMNLPVDIDSTLTFKVLLNEKAQEDNFFSAGPINEVKTDKVNYKLNVQIKDIASERSNWGGRVNVKKLSKEVKIKSDYGSSTIPLKVQFNTYNVLSQFTNFSLDLSGDVDLGRDRGLRYYYQTIISSNSLVGTQFLGSYRFAEYRSRDYTLAVGDIGQNMELLLNGTGARGTYRFDKVDVSAIYVSRPQSGNINNSQQSFGASSRFKSGKGWNAETEVVYQIDEFNQVDRKLVTGKGNYRFGNQGLAEFKVGYSQEDHVGTDSTFTTPGFGITARYTGRIKGLSLSSQLRYNSANYSSQFRGTKALNVNARYPLQNNTFVGLRVNMNERDPEIYSKGILFPQRFFKRNTYEARYGWYTPGGNFIVYPKVFDEEYLDVRTLTTGAGITFSTNRNTDVRFFSRFYTGFTKAKDYEIKPYLVNRWENVLRYKNLNFSARYYYGPYNVLDNLRVIEDGINPQSFYLSAFATLNFQQARLSVRPMFTMSYESVLARWRMNIAPMITYYSKSGFEFYTTIEYFNVNQGESPLSSISDTGFEVFNPFSQSNTFLRFGVTKQFNIKKPGKKSHELEVVVFKDMNGNNMRDKGEDFERNVIVKVGEETLMTDSEGNVIFYDLPQGDYSIQTELLTNSEGWFKSKGFDLSLNSDQVVFIPLKRGVQIKGNLILQQAQYSALGENGMNLSGVRVTAEGIDGEKYYGVTDMDGKFRIYVPYGEYTISVNENAFDQQFQFAQTSYTLPVNNVNVNYQLTFYLIEKRRAVNIRRFNNN